MTAPEVQRPQVMRICEECGAAACLPDDWYCDDCIAEMMCGFEDQQTEPEACSDCQTGTASVFGLCDQCYDLIYSTRAPYTGTHRTLWTPTPEPEPVIPPFHEEVQHLRWTTHPPRKRVRVAVA